MAERADVAAPAPQLLRNALARGGVAGTPPLLSVVVPFLAYDVRPLAMRLLSLARGVATPVPLLFVDDGSKDRSFSDQLWTVFESADQPCTLAVLPANVGRARVRNYLCQLAETPYLLYLDADMWPDNDDFLQRYIEWVDQGGVEVIYGGRSAAKVVLTAPEFALHRKMTTQREALPAVVRRQSPAYHFYSCNFVVKRELLERYPLNEAFTGWGWEDCEWAARVAERHAIRHEDNPASHLGLLTPEQILKKYDESLGNFELMLNQRPEIIKPTALYRVASLIGRLRLSAGMALLARRLVGARSLPDGLRMRGLMFYKAALYARIVHAADRSRRAQ